MGVAPAKYPPPWRASEALGVPTDADPIEVGILIVGAGPAGLACAIRLGQLLEEDPETAGRLGDVPVAVLEKGKQARSSTREACNACSAAGSGSTRCRSMERSRTSPSIS